jgi:hypothetical protein
VLGDAQRQQDRPRCVPRLVQRQRWDADVGEDRLPLSPVVTT